MHNTIAGVKVFVKKHSTTSRSSPAAAKIGKTTKSATTSKKLLIQKHPKGRADSDANPRRLHRSSASLSPALKQATAQRHKIKIGTVDKKRRFSGQGKSKDVNAAAQEAASNQFESIRVCSNHAKEFGSPKHDTVAKIHENYPWNSAGSRRQLRLLMIQDGLRPGDIIEVLAPRSAKKQGARWFLEILDGTIKRKSSEDPIIASCKWWVDWLPGLTTGLDLDRASGVPQDVRSVIDWGSPQQMMKNQNEHWTPKRGMQAGLPSSPPGQSKSSENAKRQRTPEHPVGGSPKKLAYTEQKQFLSQPSATNSPSSMKQSGSGACKSAARSKRSLSFEDSAASNVTRKVRNACSMKPAASVSGHAERMGVSYIEALKKIDDTHLFIDFMRSSCDAAAMQIMSKSSSVSDEQLRHEIFSSSSKKWQQMSAGDKSLYRDQQKALELQLIEPITESEECSGAEDDGADSTCGFPDALHSSSAFTAFTPSLLHGTQSPLSRIISEFNPSPVLLSPVPIRYVPSSMY